MIFFGKCLYRGISPQNFNSLNLGVLEELGSKQTDWMTSYCFRGRIKSKSNLPTSILSPQQGGTLPHKKTKDKTSLKPPRDSGSSGGDRDRSSGGSGNRKSGSSGRMVRKPSRELLKVQNQTDSSDDDGGKFSTCKRSSAASKRSRKSFHPCYRFNMKKF